MAIAVDLGRKATKQTKRFLFTAFLQRPLVSLHNGVGNLFSLKTMFVSYWLIEMYQDFS